VGIRSWMRDNAPPLIIAMLFWFLVLVMATIGAGHSKDNPVVDFAAIIGSFGQVFFAGAIFFLAIQQFSHFKAVTERQARIDAYDGRRAIFIALTEFLDFTYHSENAGSGVALANLVEEISHLFSEATTENALEAMAHYNDFTIASFNFEQASKTSATDAEELKELARQSESVRAKVTNALEETAQSMSREMIIGELPL